MKNTVFIFLVSFVPLLLMLSGCKSGRKGNQRELTSDTTRFYPVNEYIAQQIKHVDSGAYTIYKITVENGKRDSSVIDKKQFDRLAQAFLEFDISDKQLHKYFKENFFLDETTHSYAFNYTATESSLPLRTVDILLDVANAQVKRVFINIIKTEGRKTVTEKAGWKNNEQFFINRITESGDSAATQQNIIIWHDEP